MCVYWLGRNLLTIVVLVLCSVVLSIPALCTLVFVGATIVWVCFVGSSQLLGSVLFGGDVEWGMGGWVMF